MINPNLLAYIQKELAAGTSKEKIKEDLLRVGWVEADVNAGLADVATVPGTPPLPASVMPPMQSRAMKTAAIAGGIAIAVISVTGFTVFVMKSGIFSSVPYTEKNLLSGVAQAITRIDTSAYRFGAALGVAPRDAGTKPFTIKDEGNPELKEQYARDVKRSKDVSTILQYITYNGGGAIPSSLESLLGPVKGSSYRPVSSVTDPKSSQPYAYKVASGGKDFALSVTFETQEAISQIKKQLYSSTTTTPIDGLTVTFTEGSSAYVYLSSGLPKPFLASLADQLSILPPEMQASMSMTAEGDWKNTATDWKSNVEAGGDFGDLTYKFNVDALKKDGIYYVKVNNMPSFVLALFGGVKGQWIKIDPAATSSDNQMIDGLSSISLPEAEKEYKEHQEEITAAVKKAILIAEADGLFMLKNVPTREDVEGRKLYRYDLAMRREAFVPYYRHLVAALNDELDFTNKFPLYPLIVDEGIVQYLESPVFAELFDYYQENTSFTLWIDDQGYPAQADYRIRLIPPDTAKQLSGKQINIVFTNAFLDINKPVNIEKPADAKTLEELRKELGR